MSGELVEGALEVEIRLAAGSIERLKKQLNDLEKGVSLRVKADTKGVDQATKSVEKLHKTIAKTTTTTAGSGPFTALNRSAATTRSLLDNISKASTGAQGPLRSLGNVARNVTQNFTGLAAAAAGYLSVTTVMKGIHLAADMQVQRRALENLTGSQQAANKVIEEARRISIGSGISINELTSSYQKFITAGMTVEQATAQIELLARATIAAGKGSQEFALASTGLQQVQSKGILSMEELRGQLSEQLGLRIGDFYENLAAELSKTTGKAVTAAQAIKAVGEGEVSAGVATKALNKTLSESPGVMTAFESKSTTLRGALDKLKTLGLVALEKASGKFATSMGGALASAGLDADKFAAILAPIFDGLTPVFTQLVESFKQALPLLANLGKLFGTLAGTVASVIGLVSGGLFGSLNSILGVLNRLGPVIQLVFTRFLVMQTITGVVAGLNAILAVLPATLARTQLAVVGLGTSMLALAGPISLAIGLLVLFHNQSKSVAARVQETLSDLAIAVTDPQIAEAFVNNAIKGLEKADDVKKVFAQIFQVDPAAAQKLINSLQATNTLIFDEKGNVVDLAAEHARLTAERKKSNDELLKGLGITDGIPGAVAGLSDELQKSFDGLGKILDGAKAVTQAIKASGAAQRATTEATAAAATAHQRVNQLVQQRNALLQDQASEQREIAAGLDRVLRSNAALRDLEQERTSLQQELAELQAPASAEDLASADIQLQRAVLALNKAKRDQLAIDQEINEEQEQAATVDLRGLSLDQIKTRLAGARAQLAVQRQAKKTTAEHGKTAAEIDADRTSAELSVREATAAVEEAKKRIEELNNRAHLNAIAIRENLERQADIEIDIRDSMREQAVAAEDARKLQAGDTQHAATLKALNDEIRAAKEAAVTADQAVRTAVEAQRTAQEGISAARASQAELLATQLGDEERLNKLFVDRVVLIGQMGGEAQAAAKGALIASLPALLATAQAVDPKTGEPFGLGLPTISPAMITQIGNDLLGSTGTDLRAILRAILQKIGLRIPGLRKGGLVEQAPTSFGSLHRLGEAGREAVLPLQNSQRMRRLLADQRILMPILAALPISLPASGPVAALRLPTGGRAGALSPEAARRDKKELAQYIAEELVKAGGAKVGDNIFTFNVDQRAPDTRLSQRQLRRAVEEAIGLL